jgi:DNA-binding CsgD family transcriptional regulator
LVVIGVGADADWVGLLEASYRFASTDEAWLGGVVEAAEPLANCGLGVFAHLFGASSHSPEDGCFVTRGTKEGVIAAFRAAYSIIGQDAYLKSVGVNQCVTFSSLIADLPVLQEALDRVYVPFGYRDHFGVTIADPAGDRCLIAAPMFRRSAIPRLVARRWQAAAAHIAAGLRMRRQPSDAAEAALDPNGTLQHAEGAAKSRSAREALRGAAVALERARGSMRRTDPDEALALWRALVAGRWSLVDDFDRDGRRFLLARRNDPHVPGPACLTARERQIVAYAALGYANKWIGYQLGLSPSTVATHLAGARRKLGVTNRVELIKVGAATLRGPLSS